MSAEVKIPIVGDSTKYKKALDEAGTATDGFGTKLKGLALLVGGAFAADKIVDFGKDAIGAASDLNESVSKTKVVFGDASDAVISFADHAAKNLGLSKQAALDAQAVFGVFGKSAGLTGGDLSDFSGDLTTLAGDLASFSNTTPEEAADALGAALRGESEPIRKYGVLLDDATLKARAMELGIYDGSGSLTQQQRILAAQAEILAQTGDAQGDFARTSDGLANKQRIMSAEFENVKAQIGAKLLPVMVKLVSFVSDKLIPGIEKFVKWVEINWPKVRDAIVPVFENIMGYIQGFIATVQAIWDRFGATIVEFISGYLDAMAKVFQGVFDVIQGIFQFFKDLFTGNWSKLWGDIMQILTGFIDIIVGAVQGIWDKIKLAAQLAWDAVKGIVTSVVDAIVNFVLAIPGRIAGVVSTMWDGIKTGISTVKDWVGDRITDMVNFVINIPSRIAAFVLTMFDGIKEAISAASRWVGSTIDGIVSFAVNLPGRIGDVFVGMWDGIKDAFRAALNWIIDKWNNFHIPGISVLGVSISPEIDFPNIPRFAEGGIVPGALGQGILAQVHGGEMVLTSAQQAALGGGGDTYITNHITMPVGSNGDDVVRALKKYETRNGSGWRNGVGGISGGTP